MYFDKKYGRMNKYLNICKVVRFNRPNCFLYFCRSSNLLLSLLYL